MHIACRIDALLSQNQPLHRPSMHQMARLSLNFENEADGTHELRSIRLAMWETPVLDKRERHAAQPEQSIVSGR